MKQESGSAPSRHVVAVGTLFPADSPRLAGEVKEHTLRLAITQDEHPPILVHRETMRVIDGMHRLHAAVLTGKRYVTVEFFDGTEEDAFIRGVEANLTHGLPLSLEDRKAAVARVLGTHPHLSDRAIATYTGLSPKTVAAIRKRSTEEITESNTEAGADGGTRSLDPNDARRLAVKVITEHPDASLREVARLAGISVSTAHDVRKRLLRGLDPLVVRRKASTERCKNVRKQREPTTLLTNLKQDPSMRDTDAGRRLLRWLYGHIVQEESFMELMDGIPAHCRDTVAEFARGCAHAWDKLADSMEDH